MLGVPFRKFCYALFGLFFWLIATRSGHLNIAGILILEVPKDLHVQVKDARVI